MARSRTSPRLGWALLISLLINHGVLLPAVYVLLTLETEEAPEVVEVTLVPQEERKARSLDLPEIMQRPKYKKSKKLEITKPKQKLVKQAKKRIKPPPQKKPKKRKPIEPPPPETLRMKMVEVNNPESETPPRDARFLSDKNRRVERETRARHTNLVKDHPRPRPITKPSPKQPRPGAKKPKVADLQERRAKARKRPLRPKRSPLMVMRPTTARKFREKRQAPTAEAPKGELPAAQRRQLARRAVRQLKLHLDHRSHDRIYGKAAKRQRELARLSPSTPKGSHQKKWEQIRSALENFIPEVQPGNQTALGTRAHPFALYIARMHRKIHRLWGFGFLVDMDSKPDRHPMNDMKLWTMVELAVDPDGKVAKATIVRPSGILTFDAAALDTVFSASPYPRSPRAIRSADGKVYLHWRFQRDQRQCGTFGVDPYILTKPPKGPIDGDLSEVGKGGGGTQRRVRRLNRPRGGAGGRAGGAARKGASHASGATGRWVSPSDKGARKAAELFVRRFEAGDATGMAAACGLPFMSQGRIVAKRRDSLTQMLKDLVNEGKGRPSSGIRLLTVQQARKEIGRLPRGASHGEQMLIGRVRLGRIPTTLLLQQRSGRWKVIGLNR